MGFDVDRFCRTLVERTADAIVYADKSGVIRFWNDGAARIFGHRPEEALGQSLDLIIPEPLRARHWQGFARTIATGTSRYGAGDLLSVPAIPKDGVRISVEFTVLPFHDEAGAIDGIAAIMRDATKQFEEMKALRRRTGEARST